MKVKVYAKLNLSLNVLGKRNGFHDIDSVAVSVDVFDTVEVTARSDRLVTVSDCLGIPAEQNAAFRAASAFVYEFGVNGVDIVIGKNIPVGAGMGGSSADAAGVVYCMCKLFGIPQDGERVRNLCASLGSDVNFMLRGGLCRMRGKGDDILPYPCDVTPYFAVTTFAHVNSTAEVYAQFDEVSSDVCADNGKLVQAVAHGKPFVASNALQRASQSLSGYAQSFLEFANSRGIVPTLTGSGSAYFVACASKGGAQSVADLFNCQGFCTFACRFVPFGIEQID